MGWLLNRLNSALSKKPGSQIFQAYVPIREARTRNQGFVFSVFLVFLLCARCVLCGEICFWADDCGRMMTMIPRPLIILVSLCLIAALAQAPKPTKSFSDPLHKISFDYPENFTLVKPGEQPELESTDSIFATPDEKFVARVLMPDDGYPGTDFKMASFTVTVEPKTPPVPCLDWARVHDELTGRDARVDAIPFRRVEDGSGAAGTQYSDITYYGYANQTCYGIRLRLVTGGLGNIEGIQAVDSTAVMTRLGSVLATVKLRQGAVKAKP